MNGIMDYLMDCFKDIKLVISTNNEIVNIIHLYYSELVTHYNVELRMRFLEINECNT